VIRPLGAGRGETPAASNSEAALRLQTFGAPTSQLAASASASVDNDQVTPSAPRRRVPGTASLQQPLHQWNGHPGLYTAAYFPTKGRVEYRWPGHTMAQSFDNLTGSITPGMSKPSPTSPELRNPAPSWPPTPARVDGNDAASDSPAGRRLLRRRDRDDRVRPLRSLTSSVSQPTGQSDAPVVAGERRWVGAERRGGPNPVSSTAPSLILALISQRLMRIHRCPVTGGLAIWVGT
jgi:hypothetical protein